MSCCICVRTEEREPILPQQQNENDDIREHFRANRDQDVSSCKRIMECVVKWSANSIGIWEPRCSWCLILSILFALVCTYQLVYDLMTIIGCHGLDCGFLEKEQAEDKKMHQNSSHKPYRKTANAVYTLASSGGWLSYLIFLYCLLRMTCCKRDHTFPLAPSEAMSRDLSRAQVKILFACLTVICALFLTGVGLFYYIIHSQPKGAFFDELSTGVACQFIAQWCAIVACTVFGVSSFGLGGYCFKRLDLKCQHNQPYVLQTNIGHYFTLYSLSSLRDIQSIAV